MAPPMVRLRHACGFLKHLSNDIPGNNTNLEIADLRSGNLGPRSRGTRGSSSIVPGERN